MEDWLHIEIPAEGELQTGKLRSFLRAATTQLPITVALWAHQPCVTMSCNLTGEAGNPDHHVNIPMFKCLKDIFNSVWPGVSSTKIESCYLKLVHHLVICWKCRISQPLLLAVYWIRICVVANSLGILQLEKPGQYNCTLLVEVPEAYQMTPLACPHSAGEEKGKPQVQVSHFKPVSSATLPQVCPQQNEKGDVQ